MPSLRHIGRSAVEYGIGWAARQVLRRDRPLIVGVTGSAGKTTTKEAIGFLLRHTLTGRRVVVSQGNLNTEFGLPLAILELPKPEGSLAWARTALRAFGIGLRASLARQAAHPPVYVLEYGVEQPGDMARLVALAPPMIAVVTNVGSAHTQFFGTHAAIAQEKGGLVRAVPTSGLAILNRDDPLVRAMAERCQARVVLVRAATIDAPYALAEAVGVHGFGLKPAAVRLAMKQWQRPKGRLQLLKGAQGTWLLDDTYNANPLSMRLALDQLGRFKREKRAKRAFAVLGDMLELGREELAVHTEIAQAAAAAADEVVLVGPRFRRTKLGTAWFPGPLPAARYVLSRSAKGDIILVKGSQSMRMEKASELLLADPKEAPAVLERQTPYWKQKPYVTP